MMYCEILGSDVLGRTELQYADRKCPTYSLGLVFRILGYRSRGPDSVPGTTRFSEK
jgi:hypothetical protein